MSLPKQTTVQCPRCSKSVVAKYWESVNVSLNPELKSKVLDGSINRIKCDDCAESFTLDAPMLYHDMKLKFMIAYQVDITSFDKFPTELQGMANSVLNQYILRIAPTWNELREKVKVFEAGLNDTFLEMYKLFIAEKTLGTADVPDGSIMFLERNKGMFKPEELIFEVYKNGKYVSKASIPYAAYSEIEKSALAETGGACTRGEWQKVNQSALKGK